MNFKIKNTQKKTDATTKSLYIQIALSERIQKIADENNTSWNNVVISMIESCLEEEK